MPTKVWVAGEEVLASDWNTYVQEQVVATFSSASARSAAIPAPKVGMVTWLTDVKKIEVYNGAAWGPAGVGARIGTGNTTANDVAQGNTTKVGTASFNVAATRLVRAACTIRYSIVTGNSNGSIYARLGFDNVQSTTFAANHSAGVGSIWGGSSELWASLAAGAHTADLWVVNAASTGCAARVVAETGVVNVQDYG